MTYGRSVRSGWSVLATIVLPSAPPFVFVDWYSTLRMLLRILSNMVFPTDLACRPSPMTAFMCDVVDCDIPSVRSTNT